MKISQRGIDLIKEFEGLELHAYNCSAGVPTIGYGHTGGVEIGDTITPEEAQDYLLYDLELFERAVNSSVTVSLTQPQYNQPEHLKYLLSERYLVNTMDMMSVTSAYHCPTKTIPH